MRITHSAVRLGNGQVWALPAPARHCHVLHAMSLVLGMRNARDEAREVQGFLVDGVRFVEREDAAHIAVQYGQIEALKWPPKLYSEDLW